MKEIWFGFCVLNAYGFNRNCFIYGKAFNKLSKKNERWKIVFLIKEIRNWFTSFQTCYVIFTRAFFRLFNFAENSSKPPSVVAVGQNSEFFSAFFLSIATFPLSLFTFYTVFLPKSLYFLSFYIISIKNTYRILLSAK